MKVFYEGTLAAFNKKGFTNRETGEKVEYTETTLISDNEDGSRDVITLTGSNSLELAEYLDEKVILELDVDPTAKRKSLPAPLLLVFFLAELRSFVILSLVPLQQVFLGLAATLRMDCVR